MPSSTPSVVAIAVVLRQLPAVEGLDAVAGEAERRQRLGGDGRLGGVEFGRRDAEPIGRERQPVEARRIVDDGGVAPAPDIVDDGPDRRFHVLGDFALRGEQRRETRLEIRVGPAEPRRHLLLGPARPAQAVSIGSAASSWLGLAAVAQAGPRSASRASMHSTPIRSIAAAGEVERDMAGGRLGRLEAHREQLEHRVGPVAPELAALRRGDPVEDQGASAALVDLVVVAVHLPAEAVHGDGEALLLGEVGNVADLQDGILHVGGENGEVFLVDGLQLQAVGGVHGVHPGRSVCCARGNAGTPESQWGTRQVAAPGRHSGARPAFA